MGMFDYVECRFPCKASRLQGWQTKDLESNLDTYVITESGLLFLRVSDEEFRRSDYNDVLDFYTHNEDNEWEEWSASFSNGVLSSLFKKEKKDYDE